MKNRSPLTVHDVGVLAAYVCNGLQGAADNRIAQAHEVIALHSDDHATDEPRVRLWDLTDGRTGIQTDDGPIHVCNEVG